MRDVAGLAGEHARCPRQPCPTDVRDDEWAFVAPYLTLVRDDAPWRCHELPGAGTVFAARRGAWARCLAAFVRGCVASRTLVTHDSGIQ